MQHLPATKTPDTVHVTVSGIHPRVTTSPAELVAGCPGLFVRLAVPTPKQPRPVRNPPTSPFARFHLARRSPTGLVTGIVAELAVMIWLCNGLLTNRTNRDHRLLGEVSLSDVSIQVLSAMGLQLAVLVISLLVMVHPSTRTFGKALSVTAGVGTLVTICLYNLVYHVLAFD